MGQGVFDKILHGSFHIPIVLVVKQDVLILLLCAGGLFLDAILTRDAAILIIFDTILIVVRSGLVLFRVVHLLKRQQRSALDDEENQVIMDADENDLDPAFDAPFL